VRYEVHGPIRDIGVCHCRMCQLWTGGPFFHAFTVRANRVDWTGTPVEWRSSPKAVRAHCGNCGSPLYWRGDARPAGIDIVVATLDEPNALAPLFHIWTGKALDWPKFDDGLPRYPEDYPG